MSSFADKSIFGEKKRIVQLLCKLVEEMRMEEDVWIGEEPEKVFLFWEINSIEEERCLWYYFENTRRLLICFNNC